MENLQVISADSHERVDLWETRLDRKFREQAPRVVRNAQGRWVLSAPGCAELGVADLFAPGKRGAELQEVFKKGLRSGPSWRIGTRSSSARPRPRHGRSRGSAAGQAAALRPGRHMNRSRPDTRVRRYSAVSTAWRCCR